jgi:retron-type reverse transcriptase
MQFKIASKARGSVTQVIDSNVKNLMRSYVSKIFLVIYAVDLELISNSREVICIDGTRYKKFKNRKLFGVLQNAVCLALKINHKFIQNYYFKSVKQLYIPNSSFSRSRSLVIFPLLDRVIQKMFQFVIDPAVDVFADPNSYGFRKHRSRHNAIGSLFNMIVKVLKSPLVVKINIEKL